uniref:Erythrocyte membrane protein band 4.2 n=1 Tax=Malurus cyaneus samueli TaxID=2593467 RepID=A0A8C5U6N6_9PASS
MGEGLSIKKCDFMIPENNKNHHTAEISTDRLMVRRGQPFTITVSFSAPIHNYMQQMKRTFLIVQTGSHPSRADEIQIEFPISSLGDQKQWSAAVEEQDPNFWTLCVNTPANAPIGQYTLFLRASKSSYNLGNFILLFNPWCQDDEVFLANEAQRQEYILNQDGVIYQGNENAVLAQPWDFSQVSKRSNRSALSYSHQQRKGSSIHFPVLFQTAGLVPFLTVLAPKKALHLSEAAPLEQDTQLIHSSCFCTVLRCLGIPTRVVTGFTWAHNTKSSLSVDEYYDEDGTLLTQDKSARVWTFHVWNECWMARTDLLVPEYSGWQALDATCPSFCGPAPVHAIKEGDTQVDYDVCYFFAAINAKCQVWIHKADDTLKPAFGGTKYTGNNISTKSVGSDRCEDITQNYKYPEGSLQEKKVLDKAYRNMKELETTSSSTAQFSSIPTVLEEPVNLFMHLQSNSSLQLGQDITLSIEVFNHSGGEKATHLVVGIQALHYNGVPIAQLWKEEFHFNLPSNTGNPFCWCMLGENHLLRLTAVLRDEDSFYIYLAQEEISICDPPLTIEFPENMVQYQPSTAKISLHNPLTEPLEQCVIAVTGRGLIYRQRNYRLGSVQAKSTQELQIPFTPTRAGPGRLTARLSCLQLQNLKSYRTTNMAAA